MAARCRLRVRVIESKGGWQWDHTGTRQSTLYILEGDDGARYLFDSFARWVVGDTRMVSAEVGADPVNMGDDRGRIIHKPRPIRSL